MIRNAGILVAVLLLGIALGAGGWLLGAKAAAAQGPAGAVSAVATDWTTTYEPDPFDRTQVRRSTINVTRIAVIWSDGRTEFRAVSK